VSIIESMVIDMNEAQALNFRSADDDEGRYAWIEQVLQRFGYRQLQRGPSSAWCWRTCSA
jgi:hypothetical protein